MKIRKNEGCRFVNDGRYTTLEEDVISSESDGENQDILFHMLTRRLTPNPSSPIRQADEARHYGRSRRLDPATGMFIQLFTPRI